MSKTEWRPAPYYAGRANWLLTNGNVISTPMVEHTPEQRRWRVVGTTKSVFRADLEREIGKGLTHLADEQQSNLWLKLIDDPNTELQEHAKAGMGQGAHYFDFDEPATMNLDRKVKVPVAFEYVSRIHPSLKAIVWCVLYVDSIGMVSVNTVMSYRSTEARYGDTIVHFEYDGSGWGDGWSYTVPCDLPFGRVKFGSDVRAAIAYMIDVVKRASEYEHVSVSDHREGHYDSLVYDAARTNYTPAFYRELQDILQAMPAMERLKGHLDGVVNELNKLGLVTDKRAKFNLAKLLAGKLSELSVEIDPQEEKPVNSQGIDTSHKVSLDLTRGVFTVSCSRMHLEEVATSWEIAKLKAEVSGETDLLMAYAMAWNRPAEQARIARIIKERKVTLPA